MRDALYAALLGSDNRSAYSIAEYVGAAIASKRGVNLSAQAAFVQEMNTLAKVLQMKNTKGSKPISTAGM